MHVLLQKNIWGEYGYERLIKSFDDAGTSYEEVHVVPFTMEFDKPVEQKPDLVFGSGRFVNICRDKGFPTFDSFPPIDSLLFPRKLWVNGEGEWTTWGELKITEPVFIKPFTEKFFTGLVVEHQSDLNKVQLATSFIDKEEDEAIWVAPIVRIYKEARFFIVGGQIVTGSIYKENGKVNHYRVSESDDAWSAAKTIMTNCGYANLYIPDAFVLDIGLTDDGWKIVELNNLNSAGLYECDTDAIVRAFTIFLT